MSWTDDLPVRRSDGEFRYRSGRWVPLWALLMVPYLLLFAVLRRFVGRRVNWRCAWITVAVFEALLMPAERYALKRGHWVYNESRILGPRAFGVPIEEPLLYYLFSPLIIISMFHGFRKSLERDRGGQA